LSIARGTGSKVVHALGCVDGHEVVATLDAATGKATREPVKFKLGSCTVPSSSSAARKLLPAQVAFDGKYWLAAIAQSNTSGSTVKAIDLAKGAALDLGFSSSSPAVASVVTTSAPSTSSWVASKVVLLASEDRGRPVPFRLVQDKQQPLVLEPVPSDGKIVVPATAACAQTSEGVACFSQVDRAATVFVAIPASFTTAKALSLPAEQHGSPVALFPAALAKGAAGCSALVVSRDGSVAQVSLAHPTWVREEGLAEITETLFVDLPVDDVADSDARQAPTAADFAQDLVRSGVDALAAAGSALQALPAMLAEGTKGLTEWLSGTARAPDATTLPSVLTRDAFGLRKLLIAVTRRGKVYAIHGSNGQTVWSRMIVPLPEPGSPPVETPVPVSLFATRTSAHHGHEVVVVCSDAHRGTVVAAFDPLTGKHFRLLASPHERIAHAALVPGPQHLRDGRSVVALVTYPVETRREDLTIASLRAVAFPNTGEARVLLEDARAAMRVWLRFRGSLVGLSLGGPAAVVATVSPGFESALSLVENWRVAAAEGPGRARIAAVATPAAGSIKEDVSPVRSTGSMDIYVKYRNPALIALLVLRTSSSSLSDKDTSASSASHDDDLDHDLAAQDLTVTLIDGWSGAVLKRFSHKEVSGPVSAVMSDNWLAYSYWNAKSVRQEVSSMELYLALPESFHPLLSSKDAIPSLAEVAANPSFLEEKQQTYTYDFAIRALGVTSTTRGITLKQLVAVLCAGGIVGIDQRFLDPWRPVGTPSSGDKEEGLIPYNHAIPFQPLSLLSYNQTVLHPRFVSSSPTGLESTSLVLTVGHDLFLTRSAPSKTFDQLNQDFNYALLITILVMLLAATPIAGAAVRRSEKAKRWA
jgi:hypothetical protein